MARTSRRLNVNKEEESYKSRVSKLKSGLISKGLYRTPYTNFDEKTTGGIFNIGLLKSRPEIESGYDPLIVNEKGNQIFIETSIPVYTYFFIRRENPSVRGDEDKQYSFYIVEAIYPISIADCAKQLGISENLVINISEEELESGFFEHPTYINDTYGKVKIYYGELTYLVQTIPGRMDDLPFGYPAFNYNPSPVVVNSSLSPSAPYTFFYAEGYTADDTQVFVTGDGIIKFLDKSPASPPQIKPSSWIWKFDGATGSTAQNPSYDFSTFPAGSYTVSLTAANENGSSEYERIGYVVSTGEIYLDTIYSDTVLLGFSLDRLSEVNNKVVRVRRWIGGTGGTPADEDTFSAEEVLDGTLTGWIGVGNSGTVPRMLQQFSNGILGADLYAKNGPGGINDFSYEPLIVDNGNLILDPDGKPSIYFDGSSRLECRIDPFTPSIINPPFTTYSVFSLETPGPDTTIISEITGDRLLWVEGATGSLGVNGYYTTILNSSNSRQIIYNVYSPDQSILGKTGNKDLTVPSYNEIINRFYIGHNSGTERLTGYFSEFLVFSGNMDDLGSSDPGESDLYVINNKVNIRYN